MKLPTFFTSRTDAAKRNYTVLRVASLALLALIIFMMAMTTGLNHDEHQYIVGGKLFSDGVWPYRDFRYIHMPLLPLLYSFIYMVTDQMIGGARLLNAVAFFLIIYFSGKLAIAQNWQILGSISSKTSQPTINFTGARRY